MGIHPNSEAVPDFKGWEVKQYRVANDRGTGGGAITLFTPAPSLGLYSTMSVADFVMRFGYPDQSGKPDRRNFGGTYKANKPAYRLTNLTLSVSGYDAENNLITDLDGGISLLTPQGEAAAVWPFSILIDKWRTKHQRTVYVPCRSRKEPRDQQYKFGRHIRLAQNTDFLLFIRGMAAGHVYLDPAISLVNVSTAPQVEHCRHQFRVRPTRLNELYEVVEVFDLLGDQTV